MDVRRLGELGVAATLLTALLWWRDAAWWRYTAVLVLVLILGGTVVAMRRMRSPGQRRDRPSQDVYKPV
jgi:hypothetical protein